MDFQQGFKIVYEIMLNYLMKVNNELERHARNWSLPNLRYYPNISVEGLR
jgi:hypothetical protein